jgi:hypothetical protein
VIEPLEGRLRIVAQRVNFRDLKGSNAGILLDQRLECRIGRAPVRANLLCEGERLIVEEPGRLLLSGGERRLGVAALDLNDRELLMRRYSTRLQLKVAPA